MNTVRLLLVVCFIAGAYAQPVGARQAAADPESIRPLLPGMAIPEVEVTDLSGQGVTLSEVLAGGPAVLIFYRGGW